MKENTAYEKVKAKAEKRIGMTAYTKCACPLHGKPGKIIDYKIIETGDMDLPHAISYVLGFKSGDVVCSHEKDTVIMLGSKK